MKTKKELQSKITEYRKLRKKFPAKSAECRYMNDAIINAEIEILKLDDVSK